jgi:hypothetical protein
MKQREPYEAKAATDKKRYEDEKASYHNVCIQGSPGLPRIAAMELMVVSSGPRR